MTASAEEIDQRIRSLAAQSNLTVAELTKALETEGITISALKQQIETSMLWPQLVQGRFRDRINVTEDAVEDALERMREQVSKEQYLVSEICIPVDDPSLAQQYYQGSMQLIEQMRQGVPFTVVAQQFSACTTAALGGDLGWVAAGELEPALDNAIRDLPPGSVTNPIPSEGAFMILAVRDKRAAVTPGEQTFTLTYASAPVSMGQNAARLAFENLPTAAACTGGALRTDLGENIGFAFLENMTLDKIEPTFATHIEDLERGESSPMIQEGGAYHVAYVCDKDEGLGLPSRDAVESNLTERQLTRISQQYLRDLERLSTIDIKLDELKQRPNG